MKKASVENVERILGLARGSFLLGYFHRAVCQPGGLQRSRGWWGPGPVGSRTRPCAPGPAEPRFQLHRAFPADGTVGRCLIRTGRKAQRDGELSAGGEEEVETQKEDETPMLFQTIAQTRYKIVKGLLLIDYNMSTCAVVLQQEPSTDEWNQTSDIKWGNKW